VGVTAVNGWCFGDFELDFRSGRPLRGRAGEQPKTVFVEATEVTEADWE
jgi:hypothetical protein